MNFEEQARVILKRQSKDKIEAFLLKCQKIRPNPTFSDDYYKPSTDSEIVFLTRALKHLRALEDIALSGRPVIDHVALIRSIEHAEFFLDLNKTLDTGGKPSGLNIGDVHKLILLKEIFNDVFGKCSKYTPGTLLHQLGEVLIGKSISRNAEKLINKGEGYLLRQPSRPTNFLNMS
jgi:hypothetical protein